MILGFWTDLSVKEPSDQDLHCLPFECITHGNSTLLKLPVLHIFGCPNFSDFLQYRLLGRSAEDRTGKKQQKMCF